MENILAAEEIASQFIRTNAENSLRITARTAAQKAKVFGVGGLEGVRHLRGEVEGERVPRLHAPEHLRLHRRVRVVLRRKHLESGLSHRSDPGPAGGNHPLENG